MNIPRSYAHEAMCSDDHAPHQCLIYRTDAAVLDLRAVQVACALFGWTS